MNPVIPLKKPLSQTLKCSDPLFVDFIEQCLIWEPNRRLKPSQGLTHPWLDSSTKNISKKILNKNNTYNELNVNLLEEHEKESGINKIDNMYKTFHAKINRQFINKRYSNGYQRSVNNS